MIQIERKSLINLMRVENERILDLLLTFGVPDSIENTDCDNYLLQNDNTVTKSSGTTGAAVSIEELQERLNTIKNKMKSKKRSISDRALKKREAKKLRKNKEFKKVLVSAAKSMKNEKQKQEHGPVKTEDSKKTIKPVVPRVVFNEEGKIVFSKIDFAPHPGAKVKKSHQNPREILKKIKDTNKKIKELKEMGKPEQASEMQNEIAWKKAFDKVEGKKIKDDPKLLYKAIKKRKVEKKKSKTDWVDRKKKVDTGIEQRQKKREENISKRIKDKKNKKLKRLSKKGRVIPGF